MARLWSSGAELNTNSSSIEVNGFTTGAPETAITTSKVRSGNYAYRSTPTGSSSAVYQNVYLSAVTQGVYYYRWYFYIVTLPASTQTILSVGRFNGGYERDMSFRITSAGLLQLYNSEDAAQVGSDSSALSTATWYRLEMQVDTTTLATTAVDARIDGVSFASGTVNLANAQDRFEWGASSAVAADYVFDDMAVNNTSGSFQNSWPGEGKIIHLKPNAAGDNSAWTNDYLNVDEVTPDNATTLVSSNTLDQIDDHDIEAPISLAPSDTINVVQVGVRFNGVGASANASFVLRIKASVGGTVEESSAITPSNATWVTNAAATPRNYSLTLYDLPGASTTAWTKADLDTAQIGYRLSATSTNAAQVSTLWLLVDYTSAGTAVRASSSNSASTGTAISVTAPTGTTTGDLVVISVHGNGQTTIVDNNGATPFTADISDYAPNTTSGHTVSIYSRRIIGGDPATYNFTLGTTNRWSIDAVTFSDPDTVTIYDVAPSTGNAANRDDSSAATINAPTITTTTSDAIHVVCGYSDDGGGGAMTPPSEYAGQGAPVNEPQTVSTKTIASASATGAQTVTATTSSPMIALSFAVKNKTATAPATAKASTMLMMGI